MCSLYSQQAIVKLVATSHAAFRFIVLDDSMQETILSRAAYCQKQPLFPVWFVGRFQLVSHVKSKNPDWGCCSIKLLNAHIISLKYLFSMVINLPSPHSNIQFQLKFMCQSWTIRKFPGFPNYITIKTRTTQFSPNYTGIKIMEFAKTFILKSSFSWAWERQISAHRAWLFSHDAVLL